MARVVVCFCVYLWPESALPVQLLLLLRLWQIFFLFVTLVQPVMHWCCVWRNLSLPLWRRIELLDLLLHTYQLYQAVLILQLLGMLVELLASFDARGGRRVPLALRRAAL